MPARRTLRARVALPVALALGLASAGLVAAPAWASTLVVNSTADGDANSACSNPAITTVAPTTTLRNALCVADNLGGAQTVQVPAGDYHLTSGALTFATHGAGAITVQGPTSGGAARVFGDGTHQIMDLDPLQVGNVGVTIDHLELHGGVDTVYGGGAIIAGSGSPTTAPIGDVLTITNSVFQSNSAGSGGATGNPGGAIQFMGGKLVIQDSTFTSNDGGAAAGGAVFYDATGASGESLTITGSTFSSNTVSTLNSGSLPNGGAAIAYTVDTGKSASMTITGNTFSGNTVTTSANVPTRGAAIWSEAGTATITGNTFLNNTTAGSQAGGAAVDVTAGTVTMKFNRLHGNTPIAVRAQAAATVDATENWWGCPGGAGAAGCDSATGATVTVNPHLTLTGTAVPSGILIGGVTSTLTVSLLKDSAGAAVALSSIPQFEGLPVTWSAAAPAGSSVSPSSTTLASGTTSTTFTSGSIGGNGGASATLDGGALQVPVLVAQPPKFTDPASSPSTLNVTAGTAMTRTLTTSGFPTPTLSYTGTPPAGLTVTPAPGTATIAGTPAGDSPAAAGPPLESDLTFTATNHWGSDATTVLQVFLSVPPAFTSAASGTVLAGNAASFSIAATGRPVPAITATGLPAAFTLTDAGGGTATITGTPTAADAGAHTVTLHATNAVGNVDQTFTLTVTAPPAITSVDHTTFVAGSPSTFTVTADNGFPADTVITVTGALPGGVGFVSGAAGSGTAVLSGTPAAGTGGVYPLTLKATNSTGSVTQSFTLTVNEAPVITTRPVDTSVISGTTASFSAAATGFPAPTVQWQRSNDGGATFTDVAGATSTTYSFTTALADDGAKFRAVFTNAVTSTPTNAVTLGVGTVPAIDPIAPVTAVAGTPLTIQVATTGHPAPAITASAPSWLTLTDHGDGTATLSGTPGLGDAGTMPSVHLVATNAYGTGTLDVTITVDETPVITTQPVDTSVISGTTATFSAAATGIPSPTVQWQRSNDGGATFTDIAGATSTTYSFTTALADDGAKFRAVFTNAVGSASTNTATLAVGTVPAIDPIAPVTAVPGTPVSIPITTTGHPAAAITATGLPLWLTLTDHGDGTATLGGTPGLGDAGTMPSVHLVATNAYGTGTLDVSITVDQPPAVTTQPTDVAVLAGQPASFTAAATGIPAPSAQWQRSNDGGATFTDIPGATSATYSFTTALADDGAKFRAVFTNPAGSTQTAAATLAVGVLPGFGPLPSVNVLPGAVRTIQITTTGHPTAAIVATGLPVWATFTDHRDGTATITGTPALSDAGVSTIGLTATNSFGSALGTFTLTVTATVPLPVILPTSSDGPLGGVPTRVHRRQVLTVTGSGFLPGAHVALGIYSSPTSLGTAIANASGAISASVTIPTTIVPGSHTLAASGVGANGNARLLTAGTLVVGNPNAQGAALASDGTVEVLGTTGVDPVGPIALALLALLLGAVLVRQTRRRRA